MLCVLITNVYVLSSARPGAGNGLRSSNLFF
uniref:Uncharacterized protein n=1 Tax=Rhizophora mucronata TaxID=61149 RepID=A0A2P2P8B0_RHIMU